MYFSTNSRYDMSAEERETRGGEGTRVGELAARSCDVALILERDTEYKKNLVSYLSCGTCRRC